MAKKKPNPQDATLRNIRALKKRVGVLEQAVLRLEQARVVSAPDADPARELAHRLDGGQS